MIRALVSTIVSVVVVLGLAPFGADAHSGKQSYLYVSVFDDGVEGRVEIPAVDLARALGVEIPQQVAAARDAIGPLTATIVEYVRNNMSFSGDEGPWRIALDERLRILPTENGPYVTLEFEIEENFDAAPSSFTVDFSVVIESDPEKDALLLIEDDWASATFNNGSNELLGFSTGLTEQRVELGGASTIDSMVAIRGIGTDAVRIGIDLMLIVVAVVVPALLIPATHRDRVVGTTAVARRLGIGLLALIAGHTVTLWLVGTGVLTPSDRLAGILAAAGLCVMAVYGLISWWRPGLWRLAPRVIVAVGLLQGFGLGRYFESQGLDRRRPLTSLLAFNIGVEIALVIVVVLVATPLALVRRTRIAPALAVVLGAALTGYGLAWLFERLLDETWPIEEIANPYRVWPRNLVFVAIAIAVAAAIREIDARADRLRAIEDHPPDPTDAASVQQEAVRT